MNADLGKNPTGHSVLVSPTIPTPDIEKCLIVNYNATGRYRSTTLIFKLSLLMINDTEIKLDHFVANPTETQTTVTLPVGLYRLRFAAASLFPLDSSLKLEIHNISVTDGVCSGRFLRNSNSREVHFGTYDTINV